MATKQKINIEKLRAVYRNNKKTRQENPPAFKCDGKCRICPYPGALCKDYIRTKSESTEHEQVKHGSYMKKDLQKKILKSLGL